MGNYTIDWIDTMPLDVFGSRCAAAGCLPVIQISHPHDPGDIITLYGTGCKIRIQRKATPEEKLACNLATGTGHSADWTAYVVECLD